MKSKFWQNLYELPPVKRKKRTYYTRKDCQKVAEKNGYNIQWEHYSSGAHRVTPDELGEGPCKNTNEVLDRVNQPIIREIIFTAYQADEMIHKALVWADELRQGTDVEDLELSLSEINALIDKLKKGRVPLTEQERIFLLNEAQNSCNIAGANAFDGFHTDKSYIGMFRSMSNLVEKLSH